MWKHKEGKHVNLGSGFGYLNLLRQNVRVKMSSVLTSCSGGPSQSLLDLRTFVL
jgi:hypothetical protein